MLEEPASSKPDVHTQEHFLEIRCAADPKPGEVLLSSREVEAAPRGPDGQFRPELAIGGPSLPTATHGWKLRAFFSGPGDHPGKVPTTFADFGPCPH